MRYSRDEILPGVYLSAVTTDKFGRCVMGAALLSQLEHETACLDAMIPRVLRRGTAHLGGEGVAAALEALGGASAEPLSLCIGEIRASGFLLSFPAAEAGGTEAAASLLGELLLAPETRGGLLLPANVNAERELLAAGIRAAKEDAGAYALGRLIALMCEYEPFSASVLGDAGEAEAVNYKKLTRRYRQLLSEAPAEIFYCGPAGFPAVRRAVTAAFGALPRGELDFDIGTDVRMNAVEASARIFREHAPVEQGRLCAGWRLGECMEDPDFAALGVFNALFGGSGGLLRRSGGPASGFTSAADPAKGLLLAQGCAAPADFGAAVEAMSGVLAALGRGEAGADALDFARRSFARELLGEAASPEKLALHYLRMNVLGEESSPEELAEACAGVTAEQAAAIARGCELDAVYCLSAPEAGPGDGQD